MKAKINIKPVQDGVLRNERNRLRVYGSVYRSVGRMEEKSTAVGGVGTRRRIHLRLVVRTNRQSVECGPSSSADNAGIIRGPVEVGIEPG